MATSGPTVFLSESLGELLELFFSNEVLEEVVDQANRCAKSVMSATKYMYALFTKVTTEEINAYTVP